MTGDSPTGSEPTAFVPIDPYALTRREAAATQIKRFYKQATSGTLAGGHTVLLDGKAVKTPARADLNLPRSEFAAVLADEWNRQGDIVQPGDMPLTRLINSVIDGVSTHADDVRAEIVKFAGTDLLCYRADQPASLVELQAREWDPVIAWAGSDLGARFNLAVGVMHVAQPDATLEAVAAAIADGIGDGREAAFRLGALHVVTTLTGSAILALAVMRAALTPDEAWRKAHVDEDFQISRWGEDADAAERRALRWQDLQAAAFVLAALRIGSHAPIDVSEQA
ncbi:ATP12 family chaperone protein [Lichenihabitans psoromatis]|uniref:ATP12 family chaperone protein n=1 Tax=Lichenihabitans psoromatis TaxID=2528642 RepID=UPI0013F16CB3|nr:ATP12 family protein [Lichenihabitans psoromatis]